MLKSLTHFKKICVLHHELTDLSKRFAGHSKWANIRHIKGLKDSERSLLFSKLARQMKVAVQEGGSTDPNANSKLDQVLAQAKRANMPAATVQSILKSTKTDKNKCKSHLLEIKGPGSCFILCEVFTDSLHPLKQSIATILRKTGSKYCDGIINLFEEKGIVEVEIQPEPSHSKDQILEKATDDAIEVGAEEVTEIEENLIEFVCGPSNLKTVSNELEKRGYKVTSASVEYIPLKLQSLTEKDMNSYIGLYERLDKLPEVTRICNNIENE